MKATGNKKLRHCYTGKRSGVMLTLPDGATYDVSSNRGWRRTNHPRANPKKVRAK